MPTYVQIQSPWLKTDKANLCIPADVKVNILTWNLDPSVTANMRRPISATISYDYQGVKVTSTFQPKLNPDHPGTLQAKLVSSESAQTLRFEYSLMYVDMMGKVVQVGPVPMERPTALP